MPQFQRIRGLHIIMAINQNGRFFASIIFSRINNGESFGRIYLRFVGARFKQSLFYQLPRIFSCPPVFCPALTEGMRNNSSNSSINLSLFLSWYSFHLLMCSIKMFN